MDRIRVFLGLNFPLPVVRRLVDDVKGLQASVRQAGLEVAWVPAANIHLTLKFLGSIEPTLVEAIRDRLRARGEPRAPFEIEAFGLGAFPSLERPRILWAGVKPSAPLDELAGMVESSLVELGFPAEERPFHPHLTLGRVRHGAGTLEPLLGSRAPVAYGAGRMQEIVVYQSRVLRQGAEYSVLERIPLRGRVQP